MDGHAVGYSEHSCGLILKIPTYWKVPAYAIRKPYLEAPTECNGPHYSSLEYYAQERAPAPVEQ
jgi:hypothetical protein